MKALFELTKLFCARRFSLINQTYPDLVLALDQNLLKLLISKAFYFINDESNIKEFMKLLFKQKVYYDVYDLCSSLSK